MKKIIICLLALFASLSLRAEVVGGEEVKKNDATESLKGDKKPLRYSGNLSAGVIASPEVVGASLRSTYGLFLNDWFFVGAGIGVELVSELCVPLFADFSLFLPDKKVLPYINCEVGADLCGAGMNGLLALGCQFKRFRVDLGYHFQANVIEDFAAFAGLDYSTPGHYEVDYYAFHTNSNSLILRFGWVF